MKVKFLTNLGTRDATELNLNPTACQIGAQCTVSKVVGEALLAKGWVEQLPEPKVKAVAEKPEIAEAEEKPKAEAAPAAKSSPKAKKG